MSTTYPSQSGQFTGYQYHRKEKNLAELWKIFTDRTLAEERRREDLGLNGVNITTAWVEAEAEKQLWEAER